MSNEQAMSDRWLIGHMRETGKQPTVADASDWMRIHPRTTRAMFRRLVRSGDVAISRGLGSGRPMVLRLTGDDQAVALSSRARILACLSAGPVHVLAIAQRLQMHPANARTLMRRMTKAREVRKVADATYAKP